MTDAILEITLKTLAIGIAIGFGSWLAIKHDNDTYKRKFLIMGVTVIVDFVGLYAADKISKFISGIL